MKDFNYYKSTTIVRMITRRMMLHGIRELENDLSLVKKIAKRPRILAEKRSAAPPHSCINICMRKIDSWNAASVSKYSQQFILPA
jgi:hypothetical protein